MEVNPNFSDNAKNDFNLVMRAKTGDQKAYAALMKRYKESIYFMSLKMLNNKDDAMDITVETFSKVFQNLEKYNPEFAFSSWLFRIASNNCIDFIRRRKLNVVSLDTLIDDDGEGEESPLQIVSDGLNPEELSIRKQLSEDLKLLVESLPSRYRNLIILHYFDELKYEEIATQLDIPIGTIKGQLFKARQLLQIILRRQKQRL